MEGEQGWGHGGDTRLGGGTAREAEGTAGPAAVLGHKGTSSPNWGPHRVPWRAALAEPGQAVVMLGSPRAGGGALPGSPRHRALCRSHRCGASPGAHRCWDLTGMFAQRWEIFWTFAEGFCSCRQEVAQGWHRTLQGQGWPPPSPNPLHPLRGRRDPQAITPAAPVPPGRMLVAMLGPVSPSWWRWELVLLWGGEG